MSESSRNSQPLFVVDHKKRNLPKAIYKEFLGNVILAVGVFKGEVELVVFIQHVETLVGRGAWTLLGATSTVDIHSYVFLQLVCVLQPTVPGATVRYKPRHLQCSTYYHKTGKTKHPKVEIVISQDADEKVKLLLDKRG